MALRTKHGKPITDEDLDRMADEAEAGFNVSDWKLVPRPGRPSLSSPAAPGSHSPRIATRVPAVLRDEVARCAAADGMTVSEVLRSLLEAYVRERRPGGR